jgi:hypothetical protein
MFDIFGPSRSQEPLARGPSVPRIDAPAINYAGQTITVQQEGTQVLPGVGSGA